MIMSRRNKPNRPEPDASPARPGPASVRWLGAVATPWSCKHRPPGSHSRSRWRAPAGDLPGSPRHVWTGSARAVFRQAGSSDSPSCQQDQLVDPPVAERSDHPVWGPTAAPGTLALRVSPAGGGATLHVQRPPAAPKVRRSGRQPCSPAWSAWNTLQIDGRLASRHKGCPVGEWNRGRLSVGGRCEELLATGVSSRLSLKPWVAIKSPSPERTTTLEVQHDRRQPADGRRWPVGRFAPARFNGTASAAPGEAALSDRRHSPDGDVTGRAPVIRFS